MRANLYRYCLKQLIIRPPSLRVFFNYFIFKVSYFFKLKKLIHTPISLVIYANKVCNFSCSFCFTYDSLNNQESPKYELTLQKLQDILNSKMGKNSLRVGLLGGEPFLNKNIFALVDELKKHRKLTTIVTNCSLLKDSKLLELQSSNLDVLGLSLYDNNWEDVERVAKAMNHSKKMYWIQTVVSSESIHDMEKIINFCISFGCKNLLFANYQPSYTEKKTLTILQDNQIYKNEEKRLKNLYKKKIDISWVPLVAQNPTKKTCMMPFSYVHVDSLGALGACCFRAPDEKKYGNIFNSDDWNLPYYLKLRENMFTPNTKGMDECDHCENLQCDLYKV